MKFEIRRELIDDILEENGGAPLEAIFHPDYFMVDIEEAGDKYILSGDETNIHNMLVPFDLEWEIYEIDESLNEDLNDEPNTDLERDTIYNFKDFEEFYNWVQEL